MHRVISVGTHVIHPCQDVSVVIFRISNKKIAIGKCKITINVQCAQDRPTCTECHEHTGVVVIYSFEDSAPLCIRRNAVNP